MFVWPTIAGSCGPCISGLVRHTKCMAEHSNLHSDPNADSCLSCWVHLPLIRSTEWVRKRRGMSTQTETLHSETINQSYRKQTARNVWQSHRFTHKHTHHIHYRLASLRSYTMYTCIYLRNHIETITENVPTVSVLLVDMMVVAVWFRLSRVIYRRTPFRTQQLLLGAKEVQEVHGVKEVHEKEERRNVFVCRCEVEREREKGRKRTRTRGRYLHSIIYLYR